MKEKKIFFISGHRDITKEEFETLYAPSIISAIESTDAYFVVGDYEGVDIMAQDFLINVIDYPREKIFVYHMFDKPRNVNKEIVNFIGGFQTDEERDYAMTKASDADIAFVKWGRFDSGTAQNIVRRHAFIIKNEKVEKYIQ